MEILFFITLVIRLFGSNIAYTINTHAGVSGFLLWGRVGAALFFDLVGLYYILRYGRHFM